MKPCKKHPWSARGACDFCVACKNEQNAQRRMDKIGVALLKDPEGSLFGPTYLENVTDAVSKFAVDPGVNIVFTKHVCGTPVFGQVQNTSLAGDDVTLHPEFLTLIWNEAHATPPLFQKSYHKTVVNVIGYDAIRAAWAHKYPDMTEAVLDRVICK